ncbi:MAG: class I tRNA ligase family protein, partial [Pseudomonadota bacterium]
RDLDWGIPVKRGDQDWPGMQGKVFYVWFDAPIEYISATAEWADANGLPDAAWERWWRTDKGADNVRYVQFMGKDNVPFHTLSFPATILGSGEPWKLVDYIKSFNFLNYQGGQFSTSQGRGVFQDQALEILPADYWRWWLMSNVPEGSDSEFTWEQFQSGTNKDLADVLGNFVSRITKFCRSRFGEAVPTGGVSAAEDSTSSDTDGHALCQNLQKLLDDYTAHMDALEFRKAAATLRAIWAAGNEYLQTAAPWTSFKTDPEQAAQVVRLALNLVRFYGIVSAPFLPNTARVLSEAMQVTDTAWPEDIGDALSALAPGHVFSTPDVLFAKITDEQRSDWESRFAGSSS